VINKKYYFLQQKNMGNLRRKFTTEFKEEILSKVKNAEDSVAAIARNYGIPARYIYNWLSSPMNKDPYVLKINRLEREKRELLEIIGELTTEVKREKKARSNGKK
jgi:transposase-like protein